MDAITQMCRICLKIEETLDSHKMLPIFSNNNVAQIFLCTQIKISEDSALPALICSLCLSDLEAAVRLRLNVVKSENYFKKFNQNIVDNWSKKTTIKSEHSSLKKEPDDAYCDLMNTEMIIDRTIENVDVDSFHEEFVEHEEEEEEEEEVDQQHAARRKRKIEFDSLNEDEEKCSYCNKSFKKSYIRRHIARSHHSSKKNPLEKIKTVTNGHDTSNSSLYCEICKHQYTSLNSFRKHIKVKHEYTDIKNQFECDLCGRFFVVKDYILRHMKVRHMKSHREKKVNEVNNTNNAIPCDQCGKILKNRGLLKSHMRSHQVMTADDYWYCDLCPRKFKTRGGCSWHIQQRHVLKATYKCPYENCPVIYKGKWELKCHIKSKHTTIRDYRCEICGKGFLDKQKLQIHTRIHTNERPHACSICTATFIHQTDLRRHTWGHTGFRPYRCEVPNCGKGFMKKSELLNHTNRCHSTPSSLLSAVAYSTHYTM